MLFVPTATSGKRGRLYEYDELSEGAKKVAIAQVKDSAIVENATSFMMDDVAHEFKCILDAIELVNPKVYYSVSYSQGDGACFSTDHSGNIGPLLRAARKYFSEDSWRTIRKLRRYKPSISIGFIHTGRYYHENSVRVSVEPHYDYCNADFNFRALESDITEWFRYLCRRFYRDLCGCVEYFDDDRMVEHEIRNSEVKFLEDGCIYRA